MKNYYTGFASADNSRQVGHDKLKEIFVAIKLAHIKSKSWILTQYLNTVYFGENAYGVGAAAQTYFGIAKAAHSSPSRRPRCWPRWSNQPGFFSPTRAQARATRRWCRAGSTC